MTDGEETGGIAATGDVVVTGGIAATGDDDEAIEDDSFLRKVAAVSTGDLPPSAEPDLSGLALGELVLGRKLGEGGMGAVYVAEDRKLHRSVAVKILPPSLAADRERKRRFLREARAASSVMHPNVAAVFGAGEENGTAFLVMELVAGRTLRAILAESPGGLAIDEALRIARAITSGLAAAHDAGIIHRDLKPENVMMTGDGQVKIVDFGLAKTAPTSAPGSPGAAAETATELVTAFGQLMGTPSYMSPEQAKGGSVDARSDIFALGVMLFEMVTGTRPFRGSTAIEVIIAADRDHPQPVSELRAGAPPALERVVARCLEKRPEDRFASCRELAAALDGIGEEPASRAPPVPRSKRLLAAGLLAAALGAAALARGVAGPAPAQAPPAETRAPTLAAPDSVLACPPLAVMDRRGQDGWLGAAAATMACERAMLMLGGRLERVVFPAALLGLPRVPTSSFPIDPHGEPGARDRALSAARERGSFVLDGEIEGDTSGFRVALALQEPGGAVAARREARGHDLLEAVHGALGALAGAGALPLAAEVDPAAAGWHGTTRTRDLLAWDVFLEAERQDHFARFGAVCAEPSSLAERFGALAPLARIECKMARLPAFENEQVPPLPVDARTPGALALTARYHFVSGGGGDRADLAGRLHEAWGREPLPLGRALLAQAEAELLQGMGEGDRAREMALCAVDAAPEVRLAWRGLTSHWIGAEEFGSGLRAYTGWRPDDADAWAIRAWHAGGPGAEGPGELSPLELLRRGYTLSPESGHLALRLGEALLLTGDREEARAIAARLLAAPAPRTAERMAGEALMLALETSQAHFGAALDRAQRALGAMESLGGPTERSIVERAMLAAAALGRRRELAELVIRSFVDVDPPRLQPFAGPPAEALWACAHAGPALSRTCSRRIRELVERRYFVTLVPGFAAFLEGAERFARGDRAGAAEAWRPVLDERNAGALRDTMAIAFDEAGDPEIAEQLDEGSMKEAALWNGATVAHARSARRAARRGDRARARKLAEQVIAAWLMADTQVPAVAEMRALRKTL